MDKRNFPKTIWFLWLQGLNNAPLVVQKCYGSWLKHNPEWNIIFLDEGNLAEYISIKTPQITWQALSDVIRINLLAKYGGIWIDATCFCNRPLDEWLFDYLPTGFFAFDRPGKDRMLSSWFMASSKANEITAAYQKVVNNYWDKNPGLTFIEDSKWHFLSKYLQRRNAQIWFKWLATKVLRVYPYFWFHYQFESIYLRDKKVHELWDQTPKISADIPHKLQFAGLFNPLNDQIRDEIDQKISPVYKLTWKFATSDYKEDTIMHYLLEEPTQLKN